MDAPERSMAKRIARAAIAFEQRRTGNHVPKWVTVDVVFGEQLPPIYSVLRAGDEREIVIEVLAQHDARHVRGIALTPTQGLARGMTVEDTGGPLKVPVGIRQ